MKIIVIVSCLFISSTCFAAENSSLLENHFLNYYGVGMKYWENGNKEEARNSWYRMKIWGQMNNLNFSTVDQALVLYNKVSIPAPSPLAMDTSVLEIPSQKTVLPLTPTVKKKHKPSQLKNIDKQKTSENLIREALLAKSNGHFEYALKLLYVAKKIELNSDVIQKNIIEIEKEINN